MRFLPAAFLAVLFLAAGPARADTVQLPGDSSAGAEAGGAEIAACIDAAKRRDADATIDLCGRALDSGRLGQAPTVAALINRGLAHIAKNEAAQAVPDFDRALELRPDAVAFLDMRATAHAMAGEVAPALQDYGEVIRRSAPENASESERTLRAGIAVHLSGDDAAALPLFDQARRTAADGSVDALRALLWQNLALQATRQNALPALSAETNGRDLTQWPWPLVQYYQDRITEVQLEQGIEDPDPGVSNQRACETTFFVALQALADGRSNLATDGFGHAQSLCAQDSLEVVVARAEALVAAQPIDQDLSNDMLQCQGADAGALAPQAIDQCSRALDHADAPDVWRVGALTRRAAAYHQSGDLERAIADLDAALVLRPDSIDLYRQRASYRMDKGESSGGMADLAYALTLQPDFTPGYVDRAWIRLGAGDKAGALADFTRAIQIEPKLPRLHLGRGIVAYVAGDDAQAVADFTAVIQASAQAPYAVLWLALAQKRHPVDDDGALDSSLAALNLDQWPGPVIRFVRGEMSPADLSAAAADPDPKAAARRLCEASFYAAAVSLIGGDQNGAKVGLEHALGVCSPDNIEYHAATALMSR